MPDILCIVCKQKIQVMAFQGTLVCSDGCRKTLVEMTQKSSHIITAPITKEN